MSKLPTMSDEKETVGTYLSFMHYHAIGTTWSINKGISRVAHILLLPCLGSSSQQAQ